MSITLKNFKQDNRFSESYIKVRDFLILINRKTPEAPNYPWGRWEWMLCLNEIGCKLNQKIGIWEYNNRVVGIVTHDNADGEVYLVVDEDFSDIRSQMLDYAVKHYCSNNKVKVIIPDTDVEFQMQAKDYGFRPTIENEKVALLHTDADLSYALPQGYEIVSLKEEYDLFKYNSVLYQGFNHGNNVPTCKSAIEKRKVELSSPSVNLDLKIAVKSPEGEFVSFCGMWYDYKTENALVEPVATVPEYRKRGLGKAAVLEAVNRCAKLGAKRAYVGSGQQFYYNIGFVPYATETWWEYNL